MTERQRPLPVVEEISLLDRICQNSKDYSVKLPQVPEASDPTEVHRLLLQEAVKPLGERVNCSANEELLEKVFGSGRSSWLLSRALSNPKDKLFDPRRTVSGLRELTRSKKSRPIQKIEVEQAVLAVFKNYADVFPEFVGLVENKLIYLNPAIVLEYQFRIQGYYLPGCEGTVTSCLCPRLVRGIGYRNERIPPTPYQFLDEVEIFVRTERTWDEEAQIRLELSSDGYLKGFDERVAQVRAGVLFPISTPIGGQPRRGRWR